MIGAGLSGLAVARELRARRVPVRILEQASLAGEAWHRRHPQLRLNTHRALSSLPGKKIPRAAGAFPSRKSIIRYLQDYADALDVPIEYGVTVERIEPARAGWRLETDAGIRHARHVVIATGHDRVPWIPDWPGRTNFTGRLLHAADFGELEQYRNQDILVVGAGNSGSDILNHLVRIPTARLRVSVRHGPVVFPERMWGLPVQRLSPLMARLPVPVVDRMLALTERIAFGKLAKWGMRRHPQGGATRLIESGIAPAIDRGFIAALKDGRLEVVPEIERFDADAVCLADGRRLCPGIVIAATGYRSGLQPMLGHLGVLTESGKPLIHGAEQQPSCPGLWFTGMQPRLTGFLYMAGRTGREIAVAIERETRDEFLGRPAEAFE